MVEPPDLVMRPHVVIVCAQPRSDEMRIAESANRPSDLFSDSAVE
jgi:hypothetical protein